MMRKLLLVLCIGCASGPSSAQLITYLDVNALPVMYSSRVGNHVVIMDKNVKPIGYVAMPDVRSLPTTRNMPRVIEPLVMPNPMLMIDKSLPSLPSLPTIDYGLLD